MCGIAGGIWFTPERSIERHALQSMRDAVTHRGPDDAGEYFEQTARAGVALGFRRLSIIDLAGGHQPLANEDNTVWIAFNGEIYNYRSLRRDLEAAGHRFRTDCDTETIVHAYEQYGLDCFEMFNGMFAIAIWDAPRQRLVLARDRVGKKPLFYASGADYCYFGSELKCLTSLPQLPLSVDPLAVDSYLTYQYVPHPQSIYREIRKLPPGHLAVVDAAGFRCERFWKVDWSAEQATTYPAAVDAVRDTLCDAVRLRLRSDVPLGAFLSGGIDSSLIVAIAQRELGRPLRTFSIGFPEADFDESAYAASVAKHVGSEHYRFEVTPDATEILDDLAYHYDEPFSDSSAVPTWYLCRETRREVTVALSGDGGDELFAGYDRYRALVLSQRLRRFTPANTIHSVLSRFGDGGQQRSLIRRGRRFVEAMNEPPPLRYLNWLQMFGSSLKASFYRDDFAAQLHGHDAFHFLADAWQRIGDRGLVNQASLADLQTYLPGDLMTKVDIASMAHSLEARQPFLDYRLMELSIGLPGRWKLQRGQTKAILRDAFGDLLPRDIWQRKKMGFGVPIAKWFRGPLAGLLRETIVAPDARINAYLKSEAVSRLVASHLDGRTNEGYRLWNLLMLELWLRRWQS